MKWLTAHARQVGNWIRSGNTLEKMMSEAPRKTM
jgi:hypothetical protein